MPRQSTPFTCEQLIVDTLWNMVEPFVQLPSNPAKIQNNLDLFSCEFGLEFSKMACCVDTSWSSLALRKMLSLPFLRVFFFFLLSLLSKTKTFSLRNRDTWYKISFMGFFLSFNLG